MIEKQKTIYVCEHCERESENKNVIQRCESNCLTRLNCQHENIEYRNIYEMRHQDMYCKDCGKIGSRNELKGVD